MRSVRFLSAIILTIGSVFMCQCESNARKPNFKKGINGKDASFYGGVELQNQSFDSLTVKGSARLKNVASSNADVCGGATLKDCNLGELTIKGGSTLENTDVTRELKAWGGVTILKGSFQDVTIKGGTTLNDAMVGGKLSCWGGLTITDSSVNGEARVYGGMTSKSTMFKESLTLCGSEFSMVDCNVKGSVTIQKNNNENVGWFWRLCSWLSSPSGKKQELTLRDTVIEGDVTFEEDADVETVIYLQGTSSVHGSIRGAKVINK